ncbi:MAG: penicillin-insensitive murein endopeptidase, partial [Rhizobiaceae bacterium]
MKSLPAACRQVLNAPDPVSEAAVTMGFGGTVMAAAPAFDAEPAPAAEPAMPISAFAATPSTKIPLPKPRPQN